jgi:hypothetical protein
MSGARSFCRSRCERIGSARFAVDDDVTANDIDDDDKHEIQKCVFLRVATVPGPCVVGPPTNSCDDRQTIENIYTKQKKTGHPRSIDAVVSRRRVPECERRRRRASPQSAPSRPTTLRRSIACCCCCCCCCCRRRRRRRRRV